MIRMHRWLATAAVLIIAGTFVGSALGTPGSGVTGTTLGRGNAVEKVKTRGNAPYDVVARQVTIAPGGHTGWHTHPGPAIAIVKQGTLTVYDGDDRSCSAGTISAGEVYIDPGYGHVHIGRNEGGSPLELHITFLDVPPGGSPTIDVPEAPGNCPF